MASVRFTITVALLFTRLLPDPMLTLPNALGTPSALGKPDVWPKGRMPRAVEGKEMAEAEAEVVVMAVDGKLKMLGVKYRLKEVRLGAFWL